MWSYVGKAERRVKHSFSPDSFSVQAYTEFPGHIAFERAKKIFLQTCKKSTLYSDGIKSA